MATYLLTWNPDTKFKWDEIGDDAHEVRSKGSLVAKWSFGNRTSADIGDHFFLIKQGNTRPKGIVASGRIVSNPYEAEHWKDASRLANYVDVQFDSILVPGTDEILDRELLDRPEFSGMHWDAQSSGTRIPDDVAVELRKLWGQILRENSKRVRKARTGSRSDTIPSGITRGHLLAAIERYDAGFEHNFADSTGYDVNYNGKRYPPKAVVGIASELVSGRKFGPYDFKGGLHSKCFRILKKHGFEITAKLELLEYIKSADSDLANDLSDLAESKIPLTEKLQLCKARIGQGRFRERLERIEKGCRVTGVSDSRVLNASHIKPWRACTNAERLDGNNGLLLSVHIDRLFDRGLISFAGDGQLLIKDASVREILKKWNVGMIENVGPFNQKQRMYLEYHRRENGFA